MRGSCGVEVPEADKIELKRGIFLTALLEAMAACSAVESETTIIGFKFIKKPRMRVIAPTIFSFSISPDFYRYMDVDDDDDDYISDANDDYSGSDVNMIGFVDSDRDDHQVSTATPHLHVPELLPQQFDDHDDVDDEEFYSAQTD